LTRRGIARTTNSRTMLRAWRFTLYNWPRELIGLRTVDRAVHDLTPLNR